MALEGDTTDLEYTSGTESEGSSLAGTGADTSDVDSSSDGSSLVVVATSVPPHLQVQYSPWASPPVFVLLVEEQEEKGWQDLQLWFHGIRIPRGVFRGERFPFEVLFPPCFCPR
ncbi:hypothetical protein NDU88_002719 [Pleurodeles waltl]|uniref:Uncharacterized protein n=1 Tax=Pleurodeles waltl TaxID=8319 RepID=A0AAV7VEE4_PLEWA|nr:hypothetical protein NDU88_002719 [Pleurodeles waltl]